MCWRILGVTGATTAGIRDNIVRALNFLNIHNVFNMTLKEKNPLRLNLNRLLCDGSLHTGLCQGPAVFLKTTGFQTAGLAGQVLFSGLPGTQI